MFNLLLQLGRGGRIKGAAGKLLAHKTDGIMALVLLLIKIELKSRIVKR